MIIFVVKSIKMENYFKPIKRRKAFSFKCGDKFGRLTYTGVTFTKIIYGHWVRYIEAICECGEVGNYIFHRIACGDTQSCGCLKRQVTGNRMRTHGLTNHPLYEVYNKMILRCYDKDDKAFHNYGGRNIEVWKDWRDDFVVFYDWCIANGYKQGLSLDRIDNDGNYAPFNCRFANSAIQSRNRRTNRNYTAFGEIKCLFDWGKDERCKVSVWTLVSRLKSDFWRDRFEDAMTFPLEERKDISARKKNNINLTAFGETKCISDWYADERCKCGLDALRQRYSDGWDHEKAIATPAISRRAVILTAFGETKGMSDWLDDVRCVVKIDALRDRVRSGWDIEKAITTPSLTGSKNKKAVISLAC